MSTPNENGLDGTGWAILAGLGAIFVAFAKRADPRMILAWLNEPAMRPTIEKLDSLHFRFEKLDRKFDKMSRVIEKIPGANEALNEILEEDELRKKRWEA